MMHHEDYPPAASMTLRDHFAGLAMAAMVGGYRQTDSEDTASGQSVSIQEPSVRVLDDWELCEQISRVAYLIAGKMLEAREETNHESTL
ncbi:MAG: hypothetical protein KJZ87_06030 [Thermoguttaceae bacterium]|nr:hypothetical protein [Thermoguttaceae bacterium]